MPSAAASSSGGTYASAHFAGSATAAMINFPL